MMAEPNSVESSLLTSKPELPVADQGHASGMSASKSSPAEETFVLPASREQTRYWMLAQLDPSSTASNMAIAFDIQGEVDQKTVEAAIAALTMRHEALRTLFRLEAGLLSQVILNRPLFSFVNEDLSGLDEGIREEAARASVSRHSHTRIDLHAGPILHVRFIHLDRQRHILALTMNHIICDGWSNGILIRDFTLLYEAMIKGQEARLPELPFQFADFALWQQQYLESAEAERAAEFWKSRVTADLPALDLPTDFPRKAGRSFPGHIESALLPKEVDQKLVDYCRSSGSTKHIVLLAAFEALCARYTGQSEFLLGSTIANRTQPGMENVVGRFANPQIIVAKIEGDPSFASLEEAVRNAGAEAYNHQDLPFSRIIEDFQMTQAGATSQFLQVWFLYQKAFMQPQAGDSIAVTPRRSVSGGVDFDLLVSIVERAEGPRIQMEYNVELFSPERIAGLIQAFIDLLHDALADPLAPISTLARTHTQAPEAKPSAVEAAAETRETREPGTRTIFDRLRTAAALHGSDVAIADADGTLSWADLDAQSSAVAGALRERHVSSRSVVAVLLVQTTASVVALLGALKSGAQVLPLPWHGSAQGIDSLLAQLPGSLLLAPREVEAESAVKNLNFDDFRSLPAADAVGTSDEAKLLFLTNAATCRTEAVALEKVQTYLDAVAIESGLVKDGGEAGSQEALLAFAAAGPLEATLDRLLAVFTGSQLALTGRDSVDALHQQISEHQITRVLLTPTELSNVTKRGWKGDRRVGLMLRGGRLRALSGRKEEDLLPDRYKSVFYLLGDAQTGGYVAVQGLSHQGASGLRATQGELSIRNPLGEVVPTGAFGLLHLNAGSLGYMARSKADGEIEVVDREERYVQLRGHRICLGEIEDALRLPPAIADSFSAVVPFGGESMLIGYLVAAGSSAGRADTDAAEHLSATLPSHMVPAEYIWLDKLPHTLDGSIDHLCLPMVSSALPKVQASTSAMTPTEEKLAAIWMDVLGLRQIDIHTPFFELGGSSLLLVRLFAKINKAFEVSLPITAIFDARTVAALALALGGESQISPLVKVQTGGNKPPLFMIHSYLLYKGLSTTLGADQPFYGLRELDQDGHLSIEQRVARYVQEIQRVQAHGPYHLAGWCAAGPLTVEVARQLILGGEEVNYIALFDSWLPGYLDSLHSQKTRGWAPLRGASSKLAYHRRKMHGMAGDKKLRYVWMAATRVVREARYHLYLKNWERLRNLSEKYDFALPQFMHNTSLDTFSALKHYREEGLPIRLTLIRATDSRDVPGAAVSCGWERVAEQGVEVLWAPGDHETMFVGANLEATASILQRGLATADERSSDSAATGGAAGNTASRSLGGAAIHVDCPIT